MNKIPNLSITAKRLLSTYPRLPLEEDVVKDKQEQLKTQEHRLKKVKAVHADVEADQRSL